MTKFTNETLILDAETKQLLDERLEAHRSESSCMNCHTRIDPLGFALENFDPVGQWREEAPVFSSVMGVRCHLPTA